MNFTKLHRRAFLKSSLAASLASAVVLPVPSAISAEPEITNEKIKQAREQALTVLKPSKRDLQHGLELHKNSIVFDAYGFAPRAALDGDAMALAVQKGASQIELEDMREEMSMTRCVTDAIERREFMEAWRASGVTCIFQNAGQEGQSPMRLIKRLARFTFVTDMLGDFVSKAATPQDVIEAKKQDRQCLYFSGNGVPLTQQWVSVEDELR